MANLFGLDVLTSQEINSQRAEQFQAAKQSRDPNAIARASASQAIFGIFGDPELRRAQATERALQESVGSLSQEEGESAADFGIRQAEAARSALAGVNPEVALQANNRILALQNEKLEQEKLRTGNEFERIRLNDAQRVARRAGQRVLFTTDKNGRATPVKFFDDELSDEQVVAELQALQAEQPGRTFDLGTGVDAFKLDGLLGARGFKGMNNSTKATYLEGITAGKNLAAGLNSVSKELMADPLALERRGSFLAREANNIKNFLDRAQQDWLSDFSDPAQRERAQQFADRTVDSVLNRVLAGGQVSDVVRSQVTALAYKLAKAMDPGGRLSDKDVEMAAEMLIGGGDPTVIARLFEERIREVDLGIEAALDYADNGEIDGDIGRREAARYRSEKDAALESINALSEEINRRRGLADEEEVPTQPSGSSTQLDPEQQADLDFFNSFINE